MFNQSLGVFSLAAIAFLSAMFLAVSAGETAAAKRCWVVAHRGFSASAPENTLASLQQAIKVGADGSEFDVYASADGALVVMHDDRVDRTTDGHGKIAALSLAQIKQLDAGSWKASRYAGERVPTLAEMLAACKGSRCAAVIHIKVDEISAKVVEAVRTADMLDQSVVITFSGDAVKQIRAWEPRLRCGWLCDKAPEGAPTQQADWIAAQARKYDAKIVDLASTMLSAEMVAELHRGNLIVWAWTVDDPKQMDILLRWGVDGITTDRPDALRECLRRARRPP